MSAVKKTIANHAHLFEDAEREIALLLESDKAWNEANALTKQRLDAAAEYQEKADLCKREAREMNQKIAELEAEVRRIKGEQKAKMSLFSHYDYRASIRRRTAKTSAAIAKRRESAIVDRECLKRAKALFKENLGKSI